MSQNVMQVSSSGTAIKICPNCGNTSPADARVCQMCLQNIREVVPTIGVAAEEKLASDRVAAFERSRLLLRRRWRITVMTMIALAIGATVATVSTMPNAIAGVGTRSAGLTAGDVWSGPNGGALGGRQTTAPAPAGASEAWTAGFDSDVIGVSADAERVYVALEAGQLVAVDAATGEEVWTRPVPGRLEQPPAIAGDRLFVSQRNSRLVGVDAATGEEVWSDASPELGFLSTSAIVLDGVAWVAGQDALLAYDPENGNLLAADPFDHRAGTAPVIVETHVAMATSTEFRLESRADADRTYHYPISVLEHLVAVGPVAIALKDGLMVAARHDQDQHWWEGDRTRLLWTDYHVRGILPEPPPPRRAWLTELPGDPLAPAADATRLFVAFEDGAVRAYRGADGTLIWEQAEAGATAAPVRTSDALLVPVGDALAILDPDTGEERGRVAVGAEVKGVIVTTGGTYVSTTGGSVIALR